MANQQSNTATAAQPVSRNMEIYDQLRCVPEEAKKPIGEGRLKGKTDINPMWRIKRLTEIFGPYGFGWYIEITNKWIESDPTGSAAFTDINLYVKDPKTGEWSKPIPGTGGNIFKRIERSGNVFLDDDCYKKCISDAIGSACKLLGMAADVYYERDCGKYSDPYRGTQTYNGQPAQQGTAATAPVVVQPQQGAAKPVLSPTSPHWLASVAKANATQDSPQHIRQLIEARYSITDDDFKLLMQAAGKPI